MLGDCELIEEFMAAIQDQYKICDLGEPSAFLGMEVNCSSDGKSCTLTCQRYLENIAKKFNCISNGVVKVPVIEKMTIDDQAPSSSEVDPAHYRSTLGSILYCMPH